MLLFVDLFLSTMEILCMVFRCWIKFLSCCVLRKRRGKIYCVLSIQSIYMLEENVVLLCMRWSVPCLTILWYSWCSLSVRMSSISMALRCWMNLTCAEVPLLVCFEKTYKEVFWVLKICTTFFFYYHRLLSMLKLLFLMFSFI